MVEIRWMIEFRLLELLYYDDLYDRDEAYKTYIIDALEIQGFKKSRIEYYLRKLKKRGYITRTPTGGLYYLTQKGNEFIKKDIDSRKAVLSSMAKWDADSEGANIEFIKKEDKFGQTTVRQKSFTLHGNCPSCNKKWAEFSFKCEVCGKTICKFCCFNFTYAPFKTCQKCSHWRTREKWNARR